MSNAVLQLEVVLHRELAASSVPSPPCVLPPLRQRRAPQQVPERMNITLVARGNMIVLSGSISEKKIPAKIRGIQVAVPHNTDSQDNTVTRNKILVLTK